MNLPRFFVPSLTSDLSVVDLPAEEARHLSRVLRLRVGDAIAVFDGRGQSRRGLVSSVAGDRVTVGLEEAMASAAEPNVRLTLAQAALKGDKLEAVLRDATMMGIAAWQPIVGARSNVPGAAMGRIDRWRRIAVSSAKQCGRAVVPEILAPRDLARALAEDRSAVRLLLVEPSAEAAGVTSLDALRDQGRPPSATLIVGPEGGWTPEEISAALGAGCIPLRLGARTLRADATALVAIAVVQALWDDL